MGFNTHKIRYNINETKCFGNKKFKQKLNNDFLKLKNSEQKKKEKETFKIFKPLKTDLQTTNFVVWFQEKMFECLFFNQ